MSEHDDDFDDMLTGDAIEKFITRKYLEARQLETMARDAWAAAQRASERVRELKAQARVGTDE